MTHFPHKSRRNRRRWTGIDTLQSFSFHSHCITSNQISPLVISHQRVRIHVRTQFVTLVMVVTLQVLEVYEKINTEVQVSKKYFHIHIYFFYSQKKKKNLCKLWLARFAIHVSWSYLYRIEVSIFKYIV